MTIADLHRTYPVLARVEATVDARLEQRAGVVDRLPKRSVGAEIGVYTGVFSEYLIQRVQPRELWMVDAWDIKGGTSWNPPPGAPWADYVGGGELTFDVARRAAQARSHGHPVVTALALDWLAARPANSLDWVYLDTTHHYDHTLAELNAIARVVHDQGIICGDDAWEKSSNPNFGVLRAVRDFTRAQPWEIFYLDYGQFALRRDTCGR